MNLWVVYEKPKDFPDKYVARRWTTGISPAPTPDVIVMDSLNELRLILESMNLVWMNRHPSDDPVILEAWL